MIRTQMVRPVFVPFLTGLAVGFTVAFLLLAPSTLYKPRISYLLERGWKQEQSPFLDPHHHDHGEADAHDEADLAYASGPASAVGHHGSGDGFHRAENGSLADDLRREVRVLCWVMTGPQNHEKKARHVKATWGKRCNRLIFMSSQEDATLPAVALPVQEGRDYLWAKTKEAFKYVYQNHFDEADWFMKADDDTYVIVENLRYFLSQHSPSKPIYFGCRFKPFIEQGYMSGGAGYVLSKEALRRFVEEALPNEKLCKQSHGGAEDAEIGKCLANVKVEAGDSRDEEGRGRFFAFVPEHHLIPGHVDKSFWYWKYIYYDETPGMGCCSDSAVSFHYVSPNQMYVLEYLLYHLRPFGISYNYQLPIGHSGPHGVGTEDKNVAIENTNKSNILR